MGFLAERTIGAERAGIVEVYEHGRMAHHCQDHGAEGAGDVGADGFLDEGGGDGGTLAALE